jgi:hypothetical protein
MDAGSSDVLPHLSVGILGVRRGGNGQIDRQSQAILSALRARVAPKVFFVFL